MANLKNYTTSISIEKTIGEIESILAKHGVTTIYKVYDEKGIISGLAFKIFTNDQELGFKLPMDAQKILIVFKNAVRQGKLQRKYADNLDQARRTGWRIIKDWVDSQMALQEINLAKLEEIFLPYLYDQKNDETLFQKLEKKGFKMLEYNSE